MTHTQMPGYVTFRSGAGVNFSGASPADIGAVFMQNRLPWFYDVTFMNVTLRRQLLTKMFKLFSERNFQYAMEKKIY